jgi:hypothetical protein
MGGGILEGIEHRALSIEYGAWRQELGSRIEVSGFSVQVSAFVFLFRDL